ncbi:fructose-1,6-bisphosphatase/inositol monophosphatase family enzyme [Sagittula marina]|uniref:Fructose-1,6-bisphosphatase/inositol monophosphatase family enzyme n=1 Tax=Sagittula marina TaxID=943940 RepID=A0A7W6DR80_9RHOB|nr:inositol monophosphatase [Sagittula marina]MBB3987745.1 fructose-1,6-bisphosphatase/inositol monophosphatase family enzyme [Sagittula marina]
MTDSLPVPVTAPLTMAQRAQILNLIRRAAKTEILPRFRKLSSHQIDTKTGIHDLVTEADKGAEAMIARALQTMFPHALIVGEEHASLNPEILEKIAEAEICFTIDPVDGTWNYAKGLPLFGVMLSVLRYGRPVYGLLYDPMVNDFITASAGGPTELVMPRNLRRTLETTKGGPIEDLVGFAPVALVPKDKQAQLAATFPKFARITSLRCACHEARMVASGNADFVLFAKMTAWDHPAGAIAIQQAGGHVAMLDGSDYLVGKEGYLLCASDAATWGRLRDLFDFLLDAPAKPVNA